MCTAPRQQQCTLSPCATTGGMQVQDELKAGVSVQPLAGVQHSTVPSRHSQGTVLPHATLRGFSSWENQGCGAGLSADQQVPHEQSAVQFVAAGSGLVGMQSADHSTMNPHQNASQVPQRSRFRGLSWDKKHQGWRVRLYYAGKQRHVGRFEDDVAAARAYDKAAVYLYGSNAITNFGLEACQADPTEVSAFIVLAKEQAEQEQLARGHQQQQRPSYPLHHPTALQHNGYILQQQGYLAHQPQQQQQQQHPGSVFVMTPDRTALCPSAGWTPAAAHVAAGGLHGAAYGFAPGGMAALPMSAGLQLAITPQQQQQQQVWAAVPGSSLPIMQHQHATHLVAQQQASVPGPYTAAGQDSVAAGAAMPQYACGYMANPAASMQGTVLATPAAAAAEHGLPAPSSGAMLLAAQQQQHQQHVMMMAGAGNSPLACGNMPAGGMASMGFAAVGSTAMQALASCGSAGSSVVPGSGSAAMMPPTSQDPVVLRHPQAAVADGAQLACGVGRSAFVQDMLHSLNHATAGQHPPGVAYHTQSVSWGVGGGPGKSPAASWPGVQSAGAAGAAAGQLQGLHIAAGVVDSSPSHSTTSSTTTSTGFALTRMCATTSAACA